MPRRLLEYPELLYPPPARVSGAQFQFVVGTKSEVSHVANNVTRKIKEHVSSKGVRQMCDQGPLGREGAPLMVSGAFAVALAWMHIRCLIIHVPLPEVHDRTSKVTR